MVYSLATTSHENAGSLHQIYKPTLVKWYAKGYDIEGAPAQ
jgi:hypothetical protein